MLYDTMKTEFSLLLSIFGALVLLFALLSVYNAHIRQQYSYKKWLSLLYALMCTDFTVLFISVTLPYEHYLVFFKYMFSLLILITIAVSFICIKNYLSVKNTNENILKIDILNSINDYVLVFDQNCEIILSTCPKELEQKVNLAKENTTFEIEFNNEYFTAEFSKIIKANSQIGYVGILHNITAEKDILLLLSQKIKKLSQINETLMLEVNIDNALLIEKQRRQLSIDIQEEIDKKITTLINKIKELEKETKTDAKANNLMVLADSLRLILADIRKIVYGR